jgi:hypothetical protein
MALAVLVMSEGGSRMPPATVYDRLGRRIISRIVPDGGRVSVAMPFMDARSAHVHQRAFSDVLHRPGYVESVVAGDAFAATTSNQRSQSEAEAARQDYINRISNQWKQTFQAMPPSAHKPKPGLGDSAEDGDPSERAYELMKQRLSDAWRGPQNDVDDNATMGIQRADVPDDVAQLSLAEQNAYVSGWNRYVEQNPDADADAADEAGREAIAALGQEDSIADAEMRRAAANAAYVRRISEAWRS